MTPHIDFITYIVTITTSLGIGLGFFLFFVKSIKNKANILLGTFVWIFTLFTLPTFLEDIGLLDDLPHFHGLARIFTFASGPILYLYVRACTQKGFEVRPILWLHFIPFVLVLIYDLPYLSLDGETKLQMYLDFYNHGKTRADIIPLLRGIYSTIYVFLSMRLVFQYKKHLENTTSNINEMYHRWLLVFSSIMLMPFVAVLVLSFASSQVSTINLLTITIFLFFVIVLTAALVKPAIFHTFPHQMLIPASAEKQKQKYENSSLQDNQKDKFVDKLKVFMEEKKAYQQADLTISSLAEQINIPSHYLSQIINEKLDCNFLDFINQYRIEEAKAMLHDNKFEHYTVIAIAFEAGFNSKSAFYSAFKKFTGTTPSKYRKLRQNL